MVKKIVAMFLGLGLFSGSIVSIAASQLLSGSISDNEVVSVEFINEKVEQPLLLTEIGEVSVKERISVGDVNVPLYCTFDSSEEAIEAIQENSVVKLIAEYYELDDLSDQTWEQYHEAMYMLFDSADCPSWYNESNVEFRELRQFFDIYENEEKNNEIISMLNSARSVSSALSNTTLLELLPHDSYNVLKQKNLCNDVAIASASAAINIEASIAYATAHATSPNKTDYDYFSADCTNFASQILENGDVSQEVYESEDLGWWHTKSTVLFITTHSHSISWIRADTFAKYMGVGYTTTSHEDFAENIQRGDFIAQDHSNDGDWNHMGFVTDKASSVTAGYYDYRVAQHSGNYHEWTSSSSNGWENLESDGGKYGRVRR